MQGTKKINRIIEQLLRDKWKPILNKKIITKQDIQAFEYEISKL